MAQKLNENFMAELFKQMFIDVNIMRMVSAYMTYQMIPKEWIGYKFLFKNALEQFNKKDVTPSLGISAQSFSDNDVVLSTITDIKNARLVDKELLIDQFEIFIRETEFELLSKRVHDLYEEGKRDEAIRVNAEESKRILEISLRKEGGKFIRVFEDFKQRMKTKRSEQLNEKKQKKVTFGIDKLDEISYGGADPGDLILWIARSGVGKSISLRWQSFAAALDGESVLHIQLEGGVDACVDKYDQMWTNQSFVDIKKGFLKKEDEEKINQTIKDMKDFGQDIDVYGFEKFGEASITDIRNLVIEYHKVYGYFPRLLTIDSLDLLKTGLNKKVDNDPDYIKNKLQKCSQLLKDIAVEFHMVVLVATQASNVPIEIWNNSDKVIDRSYTEGDKTLVKPYSFVFTINMTIEEKNEERCRIYVDKLRDYKGSCQVFTIATNYDRGRFYHRKKTMELYNDTSKMIQQQDTKEKKSSLKSRKTSKTSVF